MHRRQFIRTAVAGSAIVAAGQLSGIAPLVGRAAASAGDQQRTVNSAGDQQRTVNVDRLNLREGPGLGYGVVAVLEQGDIVSLTGDTRWADGYEWVSVAVWGTSLSGWVAAEFLSGGGGSPFPPDSYVHVATDRLNLRSGAGLGYSVIGAYDEGTNAIVTGNGASADGYLWVPVEVEDGASGWFASEFLEAGFGDIPKDRVQVADGPLNVRSEPGLDSEIWFAAPTGAYGTVMDPDFVDADGYTWVYVQLDDNAVIGWMALAFLNYIDVA